MRDGVLTKAEAFAEINKIQDDYIDELMKLIDSPDYEAMKTIDFTSATGTGKTKMMSKLINRYPNCYFIITTLSKGQLHIQTRNNLFKDCNNDNFVVYGTADYKINSRLQAQDIIDKIPLNTKCIWLRDEGHIKTNKYDELLKEKCYKVINFSATNIHNDIKCNFTQTMMLRTVNQENGTVDRAIHKLIEIKNAHKNVSNYNPCAIFRCVKNDEKLYKRIIELCKKNKLKYIDITNEPFIMAELCKDDNEYDVIINKMKIVEGIDIRRAHVLFMDNQPSNVATTIQVIGRCRRNALLYRNDIDILDPSNEELLKNTRECYVYYNVDEMNVSTDETGELQYAFCNHISCQELKPGMPINVVNGQLQNGLYVIELLNNTGQYNIKIDENTGFNVVDPITVFYDKDVECFNENFIYYRSKISSANDIKKYFPVYNPKYKYLFYLGKYEKDEKEAYYKLIKYQTIKNISFKISTNVLCEFNNKTNKFSYNYIFDSIKDICLDTVFNLENNYSIIEMKRQLEDYVSNNKDKKGNIGFSHFIESLGDETVYINNFVYKIIDIFSEDEITLIKFYFVKRRKDGLSINTFKALTKKIVENRQKYYFGVYGKNYDIRDFFDDVLTEDISIEQMSRSIDNYLNSHIEDNEPTYCRKTNILDEVASFTELYCDYHEKIFVNYSCIKLEEKGFLESEIIDRIEELKRIMDENNLDYKNKNEIKILYTILENEIQDIYPCFYKRDFNVDVYPPKILSVDADNVVDYFEEFNKCFVEMKKNRIYFADSKKAVESIIDSINKTKYELENNIINTVNYHLDSFFRELTDQEEKMFERKTIVTKDSITESELKELENKEPCFKILNDKESAIIGVDLMRQFKSENGDVVWYESKTVSSKVNGFNKLNTFISRKYKAELEESRLQLFTGKNYFELDKKQNSMIGYCVEYYSKYLIYGKEYLERYIEKAKHGKGRYAWNEECLVVRACMLKYRDEMMKSFGVSALNVIKTISLERLIEEKKFVDLVAELGKRTAKYVKNELYPNAKPKDDIDPNLSIRHISGLADYITLDTILDVKVRNNIDERCIRQVLAYHYLSTKRSDLHINRVIVYDAVSDKAVVIKISEDNLVNKNVFDC